MPDLDKSLPTPADYQAALDIQDACNLSGVVRAFARVTERIWNEARALGEGTEYVNTHPIAVLYADKVASLTRTQGFDAVCADVVNTAWRLCARRAKGEDMPVPEREQAAMAGDVSS